MLNRSNRSVRLQPASSLASPRGSSAVGVGGDGDGDGGEQLVYTIDVEVSSGVWNGVNRGKGCNACRLIYKQASKQ